MDYRRSAEAIKTVVLHCDALAPVGKTTLLTSLFHTAPQAARWGAMTLVGFFKSKWQLLFYVQMPIYP
jgi:hypothetical protein